MVLPKPISADTDIPFHANCQTQELCQVLDYDAVFPEQTPKTKQTLSVHGDSTMLAKVANLRSCASKVEALSCREKLHSAIRLATTLVLLRLASAHRIVC